MNVSDSFQISPLPLPPPSLLSKISVISSLLTSTGFGDISDLPAEKEMPFL